MFEPRENSCFLFLYGPMTSGKTLEQTTNWSTSLKIPYVRNGGKSPCSPFSYVGSKFKCMELIFCWKGNFIRISIVLRTRVQKWTYFELLPENRRI